MKLTKRLEQALAILLMFVRDMSCEYPDAHAAVCAQFNLSDAEARKLTAAYDAQG